jgi:hypothetical protein
MRVRKSVQQCDCPGLGRKLSVTKLDNRRLRDRELDLVFGSLDTSKLSIFASDLLIGVLAPTNIVGPTPNYVC